MLLYAPVAQFWISFRVRLGCVLRLTKSDCTHGAGLVTQ